MMWLVEITDAKRDYVLGVFSSVVNAHAAAKLFIKEHYNFGTLDSAASYIITKIEIDKNIGVVNNATPQEREKITKEMRKNEATNDSILIMSGITPARSETGELDCGCPYKDGWGHDLDCRHVHEPKPTSTKPPDDVAHLVHDLREWQPVLYLIMDEHRPQLQTDLENAADTIERLVQENDALTKVNETLLADEKLAQAYIDLRNAQATIANLNQRLRHTRNDHSID